MKGKVIVTGGNGQLAQCMQYILFLREMDFLFEYEYIFARREELDITNSENIESFLSKYEDVKYIINCAAYTNVDLAEKKEEWETVYSINKDGVLNLGKYCKEHDIFLITFGTDYLYGNSVVNPITESEDFSPINVYGISKARGINALQNLWSEEDVKKYLVINTSWLYSEFGNNFVKKMYDIIKTGGERKVIYDQIGCPTYGLNLAHFIIDFVENGKLPDFNILNFAGKGVASWYDIAKEIEFTLGVIESPNIKPCLTKDFKTIAKRPKYSLLDVSLLERTYGEDSYIRYWRRDVERCVRNLIKNDLKS